MNAQDILIDPNSESQVLRAAAILLVRILDAGFGPWTDQGSGLQAREVALRLRIEEVLKGEVRQAPGVPFEVRVVQRRPSGPRSSDFYGLWSYVPLTAGTELLAFCRGGSDDARLLLAEESCEELWDDPQALQDTRAALALETAGLSPFEVLAAAEAQAAERGSIFARYVLARSRPAVASPVEPALDMASPGLPAGLAAPMPDPFEMLVRRLEDPRTPALARDAYLTSILDLASQPAQVDRLIEALNRLLLLPEAAPLHPTIREVYLPNLLAARQGEP